MTSEQSLKQIWWRQDAVPIYVMITLLTVLNITSIVAARNAENAASRAATIVEAQHINRDFLSELMETTGNCTLLSSAAVNTGEIEFTPEAISQYYAKCVQDRTPPAPRDAE